MCVFLCSSRLVPCTSWLGLRCGAVCLGLGCSRAPPLLAGVLGCHLSFYRTQSGQNPDSIQMVDKIDTSLLCIKLFLKILWFLPIIHNKS